MRGAAIIAPMKRSLFETCVWESGGVSFSNDKSLLNIGYVHAYLANESYWAKGIAVELVRKSVAGSFCFGIYRTADVGANGAQIGFARVVSDGATFGYLADVFVDPGERGKGLSKKLMEFIFSFEEVRGFRRFMLGTKDAHGLYAQYGFKPLAAPERFMEVHNPGVYATR